MELCSMSCGSLLGRGIWRRTDPCICMAEPLHCSPEINTTLSTGYNPIQNKKFFLKSPLTLETQTASVYTGTCTLPLRSLQQTLKEMHEPETRVQNNQCSFIVIYYLRGSTQTVFCGEAVKCAISILPSSWLSWRLQPNSHTAGSWQICRSGRGWGGWAGEGPRERGSGCSPLASSPPLQFFTLPGRFLSWIHWLP